MRENTYFEPKAFSIIKGNQPIIRNRTTRMYLSKKITKTHNNINYYKFYFDDYFKKENTYLSEKDGIIYLTRLDKFIFGNQVKDTILYNTPFINFKNPSKNDSLYIGNLFWIKDRTMVYDSMQIDVKNKDTLLVYSLVKPKRNSKTIERSSEESDIYGLTISRKRGFINFKIHYSNYDVIYDR